MTSKVELKVKVANTLMAKLSKSTPLFMQEQTMRGQVVDLQTWFLAGDPTNKSAIDASSARQRVAQSDPLKSLTFRFTVAKEDVNRQGEMDDASLSRLNSDVGTLCKIVFSGARMTNAGAATTMSARIQRCPKVGDTIDLVCTILGHSESFIYLHTEVYLVDCTVSIEQSRQVLLGTMGMTKFTPPPPSPSTTPRRSKL
ncbi:hypothetical protein H4R35_003465 [Dimargaris xerosporica]|nr:hypothetical protein H4R35_003465 [Dimargaris xerosporica]